MAEKPHKQESMKIRSRAGKVANQSIAQVKLHSGIVYGVSIGNYIIFLIQELGKIHENQEVL